MSTQQQIERVLTGYGAEFIGVERDKAVFSGPKSGRILRRNAREILERPRVIALSLRAARTSRCELVSA